MATAPQPDLTQIRAELRRIISEVVGADLEDIDDETPLLDYVTSSLALLAGIRMVYDRYGVLIPLRPLLEGAGNLRALSAFIDQALQAHDKNMHAALNGVEAGEQAQRSVALAPSQRHIGFLSRYSSGAAAAYNEQLAVRLDGPLHGPALRAAFEAVVERYEAAQAALSPTEDAISFRSGRFELPISHCSHAELDRRLAEIGSQPFEAGGRMFRAELLRQGESEHVLALAGHALVVEHEALLTMLDDIAGFYNVFCRADGSQTTPAAVQLTEYLLRREQAAIATRAAAEDYWKGALAAGSPPLQLPCDRLRPAVKNYAGARLSTPLPQDILDHLATSARLPPSTIVFGALTAFLHRLAAQPDLVIGTRSMPIGVNGESRVVAAIREMLPIRSSYDPQRSVAEHVRIVADKLAVANAHRALSLSEIIRLLKVPRDQSRPPLFSAAFRALACEVLPNFDALRATLITVPVERARYDIEFILVSSPEGMQLCCDYSTELFDGATVSRWMAGFVEYLRASLNDPTIACGLLPMMSEGERRTILQDWNATAKPYPQHPTTLDLIVERAREAPDHVAIRCKSQELTYAQLLSSVEHTATMLSGYGVARGSRVAILLRRSPALVAAMLGAWRAGAAYVPIDPELPGKRIAFVLADAEVATVITSRDLANTIDPASGARPLCIDEEGLSATGALPKAPAGAREDSAYVIYTSGSTGEPKGVEVTHCGLVNCLLAVAELIGFCASDSLLALTTPSFDVSAVELFMPLIAGGILELAEDGVLADGIRLTERIERSKPSYVQATPSTWKTVLAAGWTGDPELSIGVVGEAVARDVAEQLLSKGRSLWNLYGPTETTIYSTACQIRSEPDRPIRIGRPLANTQVYVLDDQRQPVPIGVVGELYIGGDGLARGYVRRPALTQERFVPNPFRPGELLYRTGDLAQYLPDGDLVYLGRTDHQVKIHGYRVELGEVEAALRTLAGIRDAVVTAWIDNRGDKQLVAHVLADAGLTPSAAGIREQLRELLPEPMIPPYIMFCDRFPLTTSGKIDRAALPPPEPSAGARAASAPPVSPMEQRLAQTWAKVLGIAAERIGRDDDFMDLGGHSLLMTQLMVEVRKQFGVTFNLHDFFAASTLRKFAELIAAIPQVPDSEANRALFPRARDAEWGRERMAFLRREAELPSNVAPARGLTFDQPVEIRNVLLTGATGFLGSYITSEILRSSAAHVHCLIRAKQGVDSKGRVEAQLKHYQLWRDDEAWQTDWAERVHIVPGDIILPRLGLADRSYEALSRDIDCLIHSAAHVNFIYPYEALKATNVLGLHEIIRFALHGRIKPVHYLSTAAIWPMGAEYTFFESDPLDHGKLLNLGYDEAKWVGERCLVNAAERGLPAARYRPGEVGGDSVTGRCVLNHFLIAALKGFLQHGAMPIVDTYVDVAPVDYVAKALVHLALRRSALGHAFHLTNPRSWHMRDAVAFLRKAGYQFEEVSFAELRRRLIRSPDFSQNALFPYQATLEGMDERSLQLPKYDCGRTLLELAGSGVECPPADETLAATYLRYLRDVDFLPAPRELSSAKRDPVVLDQSIGAVLAHDQAAPRHATA